MAEATYTEGKVEQVGALRVELDGKVLLVGIDRQDKRNALDDPAVEAIEQVFSGLPSTVAAAVIHGIGPHFSAGLDLSELTERNVTEGISHSRSWHRAFEFIEFGKVPVICALKGAVIGGGLELAAAGHIRVAERGAFYALPEGQRGIFVGGGGSVRVPKLIGVTRMMDMMLTGRTYSAEEGQAIGVSHYLVEQGEALPKALELAHRVATNAPMTNFSVIHALPRIAEADPATGYLVEALTSSIAQAEDEAKQRVRAFLEKRASKVVPNA